MALIVKDSLIPELKKFGVSDKIELCYNCGECTATCSISETNGSMFPRTIIRYLQLGLKDKIKQNSDVWNCYYCGDCSESCPRGAEPAEIMMGVRRYLTAEYDVTGLGKRIYTSSKAVWLIIAFWMILPLILLAAIHTVGDRFYDGKIGVNTDEVALNEFAPVDIIANVSHLYALFLAAILLSGMWRMYRWNMNPKYLEAEVKFTDYIKEAYNSAWSLLTVRKWRECDEEEQSQTRRWAIHGLLMIGYLGMFAIVVLFLPWFQTDEIYPITNPQRWVGYILTLFILIGTVEPMIGRLRKKEKVHEFTHHTDWMLPLTIFLVAVTGILVHVLRYMELPWPVYIMYALHLMATAVMLSTEVGIAKWSHIFYRPLGSFLEGVKTRAILRKESLKTS